ncbi:MAG: serine/threonine-protein kinase [Acidobacteriota bacterium]
MSAGDETGWDETDTGPPGAGGFGEQPTLIRGQRGAPPALLAPGTRLDRHVVQGELGRGGMGIVWLAQDELLGRQVALKTIRGSIAADGASFRAFENEARMLACLNHPNIATVHDLIVHRGDPVLVMELLDGEDLASRLERGPLGVEETLRVGVQVAMGLAAAHQRGIIHRDLKPANVQLMSSGDAKILDFGLAREWIPGDVVELDGELAGTPAYMSPEQLSGKSLDGRSDLYSFGLLLIECLTAHRALVEGQT